MIESIFTEKTIIKKIIIAIIFVFMFNFTFTYLGNNVVWAADEGAEISDKDMEREGGGWLLLPLQKLILFLADAALELLQRSFVADKPITITASADEMKDIDWGAVAGIAIAAVAFCVACIVTYGAASAAFTTVGGAIAGATGMGAKITAAAVAMATVAKGTAAVIVGGTVFAGLSLATICYFGDKFIDSIKGEFELPVIQYTPEEIFGNKIPMFNINFFNPGENVQLKSGTEIAKLDDLKINGTVGSMHKELGYKYQSAHKEWIELVDSYSSSEYTWLSTTATKKSGYEGVQRYPDWVRNMTRNKEGMFLIWDNVNEGWNYGVFLGNGTYSTDRRGTGVRWDNKFKTLGISEDYVPSDGWLEAYFWIDRNGDSYKLIKMVHWVNSGKDNETMLYELELDVEDGKIFITEEKEYISSSLILQENVSKIYNALRTVAIVALLTILVYVGIRIVLSSASKDKAKYKQMLLDWLVAFIMLFVLHYIMAFTIDIAETLTDVCDGSNIENIPMRIPNGTKLKTDDWGYSERLDKGDQGADVWATNFIGTIRFYAGLVQKRGYTMKGIMYTIMYVVLVIYIVMFTFQYMKRVLYMAFLTMIAPLVAITYPIDKINDGKAQGFSFWLREYIFNALLQPIHYILYVIIMGSVMGLVIEYPVYALVALGFLLPAEKIIRKMFGFEKASTVGAFGGAAGAAMLMGGLQKLRHKPHGNGQGKLDNGAKGTDKFNTKTKSINIDPEGLGAASNSNVPITSSNNNSSNSEGPDPDQMSIYDSPAVTNTATGSSRNLPSPGDDDFVGPLLQENTGSKGGFRNGLNALAGHYTRRMINGARRMKPIRALRRGVTWGLGAATLGTIGLAAGIASGDASKAFQYTTGAAMVGGSLGRNLGDSASNLIGFDDAKEVYKAGALGEKAYDEKQKKKYNRDFKNNVSNYDTAIKRVSPSGWEEMSKDGGIIDEAIKKYGINDVGEMCNIYKAQQELEKDGRFNGDSQGYAFAAYKLSKEFSNYSSDTRVNKNLEAYLESKNLGAYVDDYKKLIDIYSKASKN